MNEPVQPAGDAAELAPPRAKRRSRLRRLGGGAAALAVLALVGGELFARFYLGLGDPPLSVADPEIEYLFKPDQDCRRFGHRIHYNHYSMRAGDFPPHKSRPDELRVLVVGDSVVNGGVLTDQAELATSLLQERLTKDLNRPVVVGNISAGSWGPPNQLAYLRRYGLFDADVVVLVLSSHDYADVPTFEPLVGVNPAFPDRKPVSALWEGIERYGLPRLHVTSPAETALAPTTQPRAEDVQRCLGAIRQMIELATGAGARVVVAQHLGRDEPTAPADAGRRAIAEEVRRAGLTPLELGDGFRDAQRRGEQPYQDLIHPNALGQRLMAEALLPAVRAASEARGASAAPVR